MLPDMILLRSVEDAQREMLSHLQPLETESVALSASLGRTLAEDIRADIDVPPFSNSAMDGYAIRAVDLAAGAPAVLRIAGEVPAGGVAKRPLEPGTALRIMTGAPLPTGADA